MKTRVAGPLGTRLCRDNVMPVPRCSRKVSRHTGARPFLKQRLPGVRGHPKPGSRCAAVRDAWPGAVTYADLSMSEC